MNFVMASGLPYEWWKIYMSLLHMYWMLWQEGYLNCITDIENTIVRVYSKREWFHGDLPQKGRNAYWKNWQLSLGTNIQAVQTYKGMDLKGAGALAKAWDRTGLLILEISRLLDIMNGKVVLSLIKRLAFNRYVILPLKNALLSLPHL